MKWLIEKPVPAYPGSHIMRQGYWKLDGTTFEVCRDGANEWDISEGGAYLCTCRYVGVAKMICERLAKSKKENKP